jgi:hypothetical protein
MKNKRSFSIATAVFASGLLLAFMAAVFAGRGRCPLAMVIALATSGALLSRTVFAFMGFSGGMRIRLVHTSAAYWGLILIAVHVGMHWEMIMSAMQRMTKITEASRVRTIALRVVTAFAIIYGVYASFDRGVGAKLFLGYFFDFWHSGRAAILFFTHNLAIMGVYVCATYYALKWISSVKAKQKTF